MATWLQTNSGKKVDPYDLDQSQFTMQDVAHSLSNVCRFAGHTNWHYSVAQHSIHVADIMYHNTKSFRKSFIALTHELSEYLIHDIARPIKKVLPEYLALEDKLMRQLYSFIGVSEEEQTAVWPEVKKADNMALCREAKDLFSFPPIENWTAHYLTDWKDPYAELIEITPREAKEQFMQRYSMYKGY